ncbi:iron-containing alcohol dehydrogenase [Bacillus sp. HNG]|uniref:iron-containing alcohol dehydrogenase n=1 Tax=Bacillus sp. HNG TaxID=2293325 RepID=UPI001677284E|nr:iron-containing alcohol dehydrogenase [Bacillus sp. HNG]
MKFSFYSPVRIHFGRGSRKVIGKRAKCYGTKGLIIRTPIRNSDREKYFTEITESLVENGVQYIVFDQVKPNPTTSIVDDAKQLAIEEKVDFILAYGGGSSMDTAKAVALRGYNQEFSWDYCFSECSDPFQDKDETIKALPLLAVTTTSGTGSHVTQAAVISDIENDDKLTIFHSCLFPKESFVDPELMVSVPKHITAVTGFDALSHALESYLNPRASLYTETLSLQSISLITQVLPNVIHDLGNLEYREKLAYADTLSGICLSNAGAEAPHPIGEIINGYYPDLAHGETLAYVYPSFMKHVSHAKQEKVETLLTILKDFVPTGDLSLGEKAYETMKNFLSAIELTDVLSKIEIEEEKLAKMKEKLVFNLPLTNSKQLQEILVSSL